MKTQLLLFASLLSLLYSCTPSRESQISNIKTLDEKVQKSFTTHFDTESANELIEAYTEFVDGFENDSLTPAYLFEAGKLAAAMKKHKEAINFLETFTNDYPDNANRAEAMFALADVYENQVYMLDKAEFLYNEYLEKYPGGESAELVKLALKNIGKTPEELLPNAGSVTVDSTAR